MIGTGAASGGACGAGKASAVLLFGLLSSLAGCRWTGTSTGERGCVSASSASLGALMQPRSPETAAADSSGVVQTCYSQSEPRPSGSDAEDHSLTVAAQNEPKGRRSRGGKAESEKSYQVNLTLPSPVNGMTTPVIPPPQKTLPLTLAESLAIAGAANPVIALAQQAVRVSQAELLLARVMLVPNVNVGANYDLHNGPLQASFGAIRKVDRQAVNYGLGVNTVAAETIKIPGLFIYKPLTDALFLPLVARHVLANRRFTASATNNQVLLEVSTAYLALLGAEGRLAILRQSEQDFNEVARLTEVYLKTGAGRASDANRARADFLVLQYEEQQAQEEVAVAAAELSRLLNLDPSIRLQTGDIPIQVVTFVDPKVPLPKLLEIAARNRPEMLAAAAAIRASQIRVKQEKIRPLLPTLWAGFSADDFGGGAVSSTTGNVFNPHTGNLIGTPTPATGGQTVPKFGRITGRTDIDVLFFWTLQNAGLGNLARVREQRAVLNHSYAERLRILNEVSREVSVAYNTSAQEFLAIGIERRRAQEATAGFQRDLERIRQRTRARPIEVLDQAKRLFAARQDLLAAVIGFDRAQFQLFVALGQPPNLVVEDDRAASPPPPLPAELPPAEIPPAELPPPNVLPPVKP